VVAVLRAAAAAAAAAGTVVVVAVVVVLLLVGLGPAAVVCRAAGHSTVAVGLLWRDGYPKNPVARMYQGQPPAAVA